MGRSESAQTTTARDAALRRSVMVIPSPWMARQQRAGLKPGASDYTPGFIACAYRRSAAGQRTTITGSFECVRTFCVSLPSSSAVTPRRPCDAITIASHFAFFAAARIASHGALAIE